MFREALVLQVCELVLRKKNWENLKWARNPDRQIWPHDYHWDLVGCYMRTAVWLWKTTLFKRNGIGKKIVYGRGWNSIDITHMKKSKNQSGQRGIANTWVNINSQKQVILSLMCTIDHLDREEIDEVLRK